MVSHMCFFILKYGDNRINGSKVTAFHLFPIWRLPPSWIYQKCHFLNIFPKSTSHVLIHRQIWRQSDKGFKSYRTSFISKMAVAAILDFARLVSFPGGNSTDSCSSLQYLQNDVQLVIVRIFLHFDINEADYNLL